MSKAIFDDLGNIYYEFSQDSVDINGKHYFDFSIGTIKGERKINQVIHSHPRLEISIIKHGTGKYYIGDQVYDIKQGDIFIINNIEPHGIELAKDESLTNMILHFEPRFVWDENNDFDARYLKIFFDRNESFSHKLDMNNKATKQMQQLFAEMEEEFENKDSEYYLMVKVKLLNMLVLLLRHYGYVIEDDHREHIQEIKIINKVTAYIDEQFSDEIKLQELADIAHMNPTYFSTFFKKYNGLSPIDYIIRKRITRAIEFLRATDKTILEISGICGFNNSANFNKMFKKITGTTPSSYRVNN